VSAARKVQSLHDSKLGQDVERPEDRGPSDPETVVSRVVDEVCSREVSVATGDESRHGAARRRRPIAGLAEGGVEG